MVRITRQEFEALQKKQKEVSKYRAKPCKVDGKTFPSQLEKNYYTQLVFKQKSGIISYFLMQVPFFLPGGVKYVVDFQVFWPDGKVQYIDTKGKDTASSKAKRRITESLYPVKIEIVGKV